MLTPGRLFSLVLGIVYIGHAWLTPWDKSYYNHLHNYRPTHGHQVYLVTFLVVIALFFLWFADVLIESNHLDRGGLTPPENPGCAVFFCMDSFPPPFGFVGVETSVLRGLFSVEKHRQRSQPLRRIIRYNRFWQGGISFSMPSVVQPVAYYLPLSKRLEDNLGIL